jgi:hypothetical protein
MVSRTSADALPARLALQASSGPRNKRLGTVVPTPMFWLFNKTGVMTVLGVLLLILAIYLIRAEVSWPHPYQPRPAVSSDLR